MSIAFMNIYNIIIHVAVLCILAFYFMYHIQHLCMTLCLVKNGCIKFLYPWLPKFKFRTVTEKCLQFCTYTILDVHEKVSENDQEIPQSQTADQPTAP